jgi:hypothetical protein
MERVHITFRKISPSAELADYIDRHLRALLARCPASTSCRIVVARPHRRHRKGNLIRVRLVIDIPHHAPVVIRTSPRDVDESNPQSAVAVALTAAEQAVRARLARRQRSARQRSARRRAWRLLPAEAG